jgi:hypothetical protein
MSLKPWNIKSIIEIYTKTFLSCDMLCKETLNFFRNWLYIHTQWFDLEIYSQLVSTSFERFFFDNEMMKIQVQRPTECVFGYEKNIFFSLYMREMKEK